MGVVDNFETAIVPSDGRYAEQRFTAAPGTHIIAAHLERDLGNRSSFWRNYGRIDGTDVPGEGCRRVSPEVFCRVSDPRDFVGLDATTIAYGVRCETADPECYNGTSRHMVWALVLSATVTLDDLEPPAVATPTATGLADGAWHRGAGTITFSAGDNTGVRVRRLVEGSTVRATATAPGPADGGCGVLNAGDAYTYTRPCADGRGLDGVRAVAVADVCAWGDGEHALRAVAEDTGGAQTTSDGAVTVRVDCTPPSVSVGPSVVRDVPAGTLVGPVDLTASDARVAVASTEVQVQQGMGEWKPYAAPIAAVAGSSYRFRARATDAVGNVSGWSAPSAWTHGRLVHDPEPEPEPGPVPLPPPRPESGPRPGGGPTTTGAEQAPLHQTANPAAAPVATLERAPKRAAAPKVRLTTQRFSRRTRRLTVRGTVRNARSGRLHLRIRTQAHTPRTRRAPTRTRTRTRRTRTITRRVTIRNGRFAATFRLPRGTRRARVVGIRPEALR